MKPLKHLYLYFQDGQRLALRFPKQSEDPAAVATAVPVAPPPMTTKTLSAISVVRAGKQQKSGELSQAPSRTAVLWRWILFVKSSAHAMACCATLGVE